MLASIARALPEGGRLLSLEIDPRRAALTRRHVALAGLSRRVDVRTGPALHSLDRLIAQGEPPFDMVFIDADKPNNPGYLQRCLALSRPGTLIVADNVVRGGAVADPGSTDPNVQGVRRFVDDIAALDTLRATVVQTVGDKGHDGMLLIAVESVRGP